jgi:hypothetical protein
VRVLVTLLATLTAFPVTGQILHFECAWGRSPTVEVVVDSETRVASADGGAREFDVIKLTKDSMWLAVREGYDPSKLTVQMIRRDTTSKVSIVGTVLDADSGFEVSNSVGSCLETSQ